MMSITPYVCSPATLPQVFIPSVVASGREGRGQVWGMDALAPDVRANSSLTFPIRPTHKITKVGCANALKIKLFIDALILFYSRIPNLMIAMFHPLRKIQV